LGLEAASLGLILGGLCADWFKLPKVLGNLNLPAVSGVNGFVMFGKKFLSVVVALVLVGQVGVFAQESTVGSSGSREIPVLGSELQRQAAGKSDKATKSFEATGNSQGSDLSHLGYVNKHVDVTPPRIIPNLLFMGLIFWLGMKFAQYRARTNQQPTQK
jgi:hypothetical protein